MADRSASPSFVAADMLSQAEHGRDSQAMVVCDDRAFAEVVAAEVQRQAAMLSREDFVADSLSHSRIIVFDSREQMVDFANMYAAEHLIVMMRDAWSVVDHITAAGSVFVGAYSPESAGDYASVPTIRFRHRGGHTRAAVSISTASCAR